MRKHNTSQEETHLIKFHETVTDWGRRKSSLGVSCG